MNLSLPKNITYNGVNFDVSRQVTHNTKRIIMIITCKSNDVSLKFHLNILGTDMLFTKLFINNKIFNVAVDYSVKKPSLATSLIDLIDDTAPLVAAVNYACNEKIETIEQLEHAIVLCKNKRILGETFKLEHFTILG